MNKMIGQDSYTKEFKSKIINLDKENYLVELENTFFYGKGGGQPGDIGILITELGNVNVTETIKKDEKILHKVDSTNNLK